MAGPGPLEGARVVDHYERRQQLPLFHDVEEGAASPGDETIRMHG